MSKIKSSKNTIYWLGLVTLLPVVYVVAFTSLLFLSVVSDGAIAIPLPFAFVMTVHAMVIFTMWLTTAFYVYQAINEDKIPQSQKTIWVIGIIVGNMISNLIYWYIFFWTPSNSPKT